MQLPAAPNSQYQALCVRHWNCTVRPHAVHARSRQIAMACVAIALQHVPDPVREAVRRALLGREAALLLARRLLRAEPARPLAVFPNAPATSSPRRGVSLVTLRQAAGKAGTPSHMRLDVIEMAPTGAPTKGDRIDDIHQDCRYRDRTGAGSRCCLQPSLGKCSVS